MITKRPEERLERARLTREMVDLAKRLLAGHATRTDLVTWARAKDRSRDFRTAAVNDLYTCLWNADATLPLTGELLVRDFDLAEHVRAVLEGEPRFDTDPIATLRGGIDRIEARLGIRAMRFPLDGLGWREALRFASLATGRLFAACTLHEVGAPVIGYEVRTFGLPRAADERAAVLADLFETLQITSDDLLREP